MPDAVEMHEALTGTRELAHCQGAVGKDAPNHGLATIEATPLLVEPYLHDLPVFLKRQYLHLQKLERPK